MSQTTSAENAEKNGVSDGHASKSPAVTLSGHALPDDLERVIDAWPKLPEAIKAGVLAMIEHF